MLTKKQFRLIFWIVYLCIIIASIIPLIANISKKYLDFGFQEIRLDHIFHFTVYFLICIYYLFGLIRNQLLFEHQSFLKFIVLSLIMASLSEFIQLLIPSRTFSPIDWISNISGLFLGIAITIYNIIFRTKRIHIN